jgi:uncharacterized LabA/DUF88 family protein
MSDCDKSEFVVDGKHLKKTKVAVFIDANHLRRILDSHELKMWEFDFDQFSNLLCKGCYRYHTYYYDARPELNQRSSKYQEENDFQDRLERNPPPRFTPKFGKMSKSMHDGRYHQKQVDILLSIDLVDVAVSRAVDRVALVINDMDFIPAIEKAKTNFITVALVILEGQSTSTELKNRSDELIRISKEEIAQLKLEKSPTSSC